MDQRGDRRRAFHRVGQPGVQAQLRGLAHRADEQQQGRHRQEVQVHAEEMEGLAGQVRGRLEHRREVHAVVHVEDGEDAQREAEIADPVDHEGLEGGVVGAGPVEPEADQQVGGDTDAFPAEEHLDEIVRRHQRQHREGEERDIGEEPRLVRVMRHIADRVDMHDGRNQVDDQQHPDGQLVDIDPPVHRHRVGMEPGQHPDMHHLAAQADVEEGDDRQDQGDDHRRAAGPHARTVADETAAQPDDDRRNQGQEDDQGVHAPAQPFIMLMSSTAIEPRLRK